MKKFLVAFIAAFALVAGAAHGAGGVGYIWGLNIDDANGAPIVRPSIAGGSYDKDDVLNTRQGYAVRAFQKALYDQGYLSAANFFAEAETFGPNTKIAVHYFQQIWLDNHTAAQTPTGLTNVGRIGPGTATALFQPYVLFNEGAYGVPGHKLHGIVGAESQYDPGAYNDGGDKGILQYSGGSGLSTFDRHAEAIDRINQMSAAVKGQYDYLTNRFGSAISTALRWKMASAVHNTPFGSTSWAECYVFTGQSGNNCGEPSTNDTSMWIFRARIYANAVEDHAADFPN